MRNIIGTPQSIISKFRLQKDPYTPYTPTTPSVRGTIEPVEVVQGEQSPASAFNNEPEQSIWGGEFSCEPSFDTPLPRKRRLDQLESDTEPARSSKRRKPLPYFRHSEMRVMDLIFPPPDQELTEPNDDEIDHPIGERLYVQNLMRKLFLNPNIIEFPHKESLRTVWILHASHLVKKHEQHIALVFDTDTTTKTCKIFRAPLDGLGIPEQPARRMQKDRTGVVRFHWDDDSAGNPFELGEDWDYLEKWNHMADDKLLPRFLESDDEDAIYDDSTLREMEIERRRRNGEDGPIRQPLSIDRVREVIESELTKFVTLWTEKVLPKLEKRAWHIYRKRDRLGTKKLAIQNYERELRRVNRRVGGLKLEYERMEWRSVEELRRICVNMQESVNSVQELQWNIDLLSGKAPPKLARRYLVRNTEDQFVEDEVVQNEGEDADGEDIYTDEDISVMEEDEMDGFVIDDDEIDGGLEDDELVPDNESVENNGTDDANSSPAPRISTSRRKFIASDSDVGGHEKVETDEEIRQNSVSKSIQPPDESAKIATTAASVDTDRTPNLGKSIVGSGRLREASSLPTPPRETDQIPSIQAVKREPPPENASADASHFPGYDSDIFMSFGDKEIAEFCQCTEASITVAKKYLLRADGQPTRAASIYFEDLEHGHGFEPTDASKSGLPQKTKRKRDDKGVASDDDYQPRIAPIFKSPFNDHLPRDKIMPVVKSLLSNLQSEDLHAILNDVAELTMNHKLDPTTQFLPGETIENCKAYHRLYLAYADFLVPELKGRNLTPSIDQICNSERFQKFYDGLITHLHIASPATSLKRNLDKDIVDTPTPASVNRSSPLVRPDKRRKDTKSNIKPAKPIIKSAEQKAQEAELRKIADRERNQKKKGKYFTTTEEGGVLVNLGKKHSEQAVCLHPELAAVMKTHQVEGLQFIWKQVSIVGNVS